MLGLPTELRAVVTNPSAAEPAAFGSKRTGRLEYTIANCRYISSKSCPQTWRCAEPGQSKPSIVIRIGKQVLLTFHKELQETRIFFI
jgi:hypothetical protein